MLDAKRRLGQFDPASVLFVCLGNVCRSPYAEWALRSRCGSALRIESAGFIGPGRAPPDVALEVAAEHGVHHADHRSRVQDPDLLRQMDAIFVFDRLNVARLRRSSGARMDRVFWLGDLDPMWSGKRAIIDPWGKPTEEFEKTFSRIDRCVDELASVLCPD